MNAFKILNSKNVAISIKDLDKEAAEFWNKPVHDKWYANPKQDIIPAEDATDEEKIAIQMRNVSNGGGNWYDTIGWCIVNRDNHASGWQNIVHTMMAESLGEGLLNLDKPISVATFHEDELHQLHLDDKYEEHIYATLEYYKPYIALINHWMSKGYTAEKVV